MKYLAWFSKTHMLYMTNISEISLGYINKIYFYYINTWHCNWNVITHLTSLHVHLSTAHKEMLAPTTLVKTPLIFSKKQKPYFLALFANSQHLRITSISFFILEAWQLSCIALNSSAVTSTFPFITLNNYACFYETPCLILLLKVSYLVFIIGKHSNISGIRQWNSSKPMNPEFV